VPIDEELERTIAAHHRAGAADIAAEALIRGYGGELYSFISTKVPDADADDAFAMFCEDIWLGMPRFRGEASFRTWAYRIARNAAFTLRRVDDRRARRFSPAQSSIVNNVAEKARTTTAVFRRTETKDRFQRLRDELAPEDRDLLVLRVDRGLDWKDIAIVMCDEDSSDKDIARESASLRKRFERVKARLKQRAKEAGLTDES